MFKLDFEGGATNLAGRVKSYKQEDTDGFLSRTGQKLAGFFFSPQQNETISIDDSRHMLYHLTVLNADDSIVKRSGIISIAFLGHFGDQFEKVVKITESDIRESICRNFPTLKDMNDEAFKIVALHYLPVQESINVLFFITTVTGLRIYFNMLTETLESLPTGSKDKMLHHYVDTRPTGEWSVCGILLPPELKGISHQDEQKRQYLGLTDEMPTQLL